MKRTPLIHRIPILDFDIELHLPRDLTPQEAARVAKLVGTIAIEGTQGLERCERTKGQIKKVEWIDSTTPQK